MALLLGQAMGQVDEAIPVHRTLPYFLTPVAESYAAPGFVAT